MASFSSKLRGLGPWQYPTGHLLLAAALLSVFLSAVVCRSAVGVLVVGSGVGVWLMVVGHRRTNGVVMVVGIAFILLTAGVLIVGFCLEARGSARLRIPITFEVRDTQTGSAIAGATVRIRDLSSHNWKTGPPNAAIIAETEGAEQVADQSGRARLAHDFSASTVTSYFRNDANVFVHGYLYLSVSAPGHTTLTEPLYEHIGSHIPYELNGADLAHVEVLLQPQTLAK